MIYLRWEYHGLGPGRWMMAKTAGGFYDRMGGERLLDDRGQFNGAYGWRDVTNLLDRARP